MVRRPWKMLKKKPFVRRVHLLEQRLLLEFAGVRRAVFGRCCSWGKRWTRVG